MKKAILLGALVCMVTLSPAFGFAGTGTETGGTSHTTCEFKASPWTEKTSYGDKMTGKLEFGLKNLLGGWTAIFSTPTHFQNEGKNVYLGTAKGLVKGVIYTVGGALHTLTFPIPIDVPLPNGGVSFE